MPADSKNTEVTTTTVIRCNQPRVLIQNSNGDNCQVVDYELYYDKVIKTEEELKSEFPDFYEILSLPSKTRKDSN